MSTARPPKNTVHAQRIARGWSQQQLAERAGLSRAGISAIEAGRLAPSVTAALALSQALDSTVEQLFAPASPPKPSTTWAFEPAKSTARYWRARVGEGMLAYPVEDNSPQLDWHDGVAQAGQPQDVATDLAERTLVVAGCDPAAGLLAAEYARQFQFRMIVLARSSRDALELLAAGKVHAAGIHLGRKGRRDNARVARQWLGRGCHLVRVARWDEGLALSPRLSSPTLTSLVRSTARWVGREEGSGARQCQDELLTGKPAPSRVAFDHRGVAAAVRCGWADVGPCVRLASEESGLRFLKVSQKNYDLCYSSVLEGDPRLWALLATLRSRSFRSRLAELPGYATSDTGELIG